MMTIFFMEVHLLSFWIFRNPTLCREGNTPQLMKKCLRKAGRGLRPAGHGSAAEGYGIEGDYRWEKDRKMVILEDKNSLKASRVCVVRNGRFTEVGFIFGEGNLMTAGPHFGGLLLLKDIAGRGQLGGKGYRRAGQKSGQKN
jgi:hypothetical protein